jgi:hypothetical protein
MRCGLPTSIHVCKLRGSWRAALARRMFPGFKRR